MRKAIIFFVFSCFLLTACKPNATPTGTQPPTPAPTTANPQEPEVLVPSTSPVPTDTAAPAPIRPTETLLPTPAHLPTQPPTPTATPLPLGNQTIGVDNALQVTELGEMGKGSVLDYSYAASEGVLLVHTPLGVYHLDPETLTVRSFQAGALDYFVLPDDARVLVSYPEGKLAVVQAADGGELFQMEYEVKIPWNYENWISSLPRERRDIQRERIRSEFLSIQAVAVSEDMALLATAHGDHHIRVWRLADGALVHDLEHDLVTDIEQMVFSPNGEKMVVVERSRDIAMWALTQPKLLWHRKEVGHLNGQPFSPDGRLLAVEISSLISADSWVALLSADYGDELGRITGARVSSNPFSADSKHLATYWYQRVRIFLTSNLAYFKKIETGLDIASLSYAPDGAYLLVNDGQQAWNGTDYSAADAAPFKPTPAPKAENPLPHLRGAGFYTGLQGVLLPTEGALRAWGSLEPGEYYWFDLPEGDIHSLNLPADLAREVYAPLFAADGSAVFYCTPARLFVLPVTASEPRDLGRCSSRAVLAYSPATGILARGQGTTLDLIEVASGEIVHNLLGHFKKISGLRFSEDGSLLASGSADVGSRGYGEVAMWTTEPAHNLMMDTRQPWGVYELVYSPDNRWLAFYNNGNLRIWSVTERRLYAYFDSEAVRFTFSPDSALLAAGDWEGKVYLYAVPSGKELAVFDAALGTITGLTFTPDGSTLILTAEDGIVRLFGIK